MEAASKARLTALRNKYSEAKTSSSRASLLSGHDLAPTNWSRRLVAFGGGGDGQLGSSALLDSSKGMTCLKTPCWVSLEAAEGAYDTNRTPKEVACGSQLTLAVMEDGKVFVWGNGYLGCHEKSKNSAGKRFSPRSKGITKTRIPRCIASLSNIKSVAVGCQDHCLALAKDGFVWSWGAGAGGKLGHGDLLDVEHPKQIEGLYNVSTISVGEMHSCALNHQGVLYTWGSSKAGQVGHGTDVDMVVRPTSIKTFIQKQLFVLKISCGMNHTAVIAADQTDVRTIVNGRGEAPNRLEIIQKNIDTMATSLWTWGWGEHGRLGIDNTFDGDNFACCNPIRVDLPTNIRDVSAGGSHTIVVTSTFEMLGWGNNEFGQVGCALQNVERDNDGASFVRAPSVINMGEHKDSVSIASVSCGFAHSAAVSTKGRVFVWGWNEQGQLGLGDEISRYEPTLLSIMECVRSTDVSLGRAHTSIVTERRPGVSVNVLNESSGIKCSTAKKIDPIAQMREEKARKAAKKEARRREKAEKKRALAAEEEARRLKEEQLLEEERLREKMEILVRQKQLELEEAERRRQEEEEKAQALKEMELAKAMAEKIALAKRLKEKRLFDEKVAAERKKAEEELMRQQRDEEARRKAEHLRLAELEKAKRAQEREEEERRNREIEEAERQKRRRERQEIDRLAKLKEEELRKEREEEELFRKKMEIEAEKERKRKAREEDDRRREAAKKKKALEERRERERQAEKKRLEMEEAKKKREQLLKDQLAKKRKDKEEKKLKTLLERAEQEKIDAENAAKDKLRREELTAARKEADRKKKLELKKKRLAEAAALHLKQQEEEKKKAEEKERRRHAAIEMKKKRAEKKNAMMKYESELRADLENEVARRNELAEKMREERLEQARARRKEKEALHNLLISTYQKSALKVKAELDDEDEKKRKQRKEAAIWMRKKWAEAKKGARKAQRLKLKLTPRTKAGQEREQDPVERVFEESELPDAMIAALAKIQKPPPTAPSMMSRKRIHIDRGQLRPSSSSRRY